MRINRRMTAKTGNINVFKLVLKTIVLLQKAFDFV